MVTGTVNRCYYPLVGGVLLSISGIVLTRKRFGVTSLVNFIGRQAVLKGIVKARKFVGQGRREGTMTDTEQERTLLMFKAG